MEPLPLGLQTELVTAPSALVIRRHNDVLLIRTTDQPNFYFGNKLFLPACPTAAELPRLMDEWQHAFAGADGIEKLVVQWETPYDASPPEDPAALQVAGAAAGLEGDHDVVLRLTTFVPRRAKQPMRARTVTSDAEWQATLEVASEPNTPPGLRRFHQWRRAEHRRLAEAGRGLWWLAEANGQPVSTAGIFWNEAGTLARFQAVDTAAPARNNGFASGLLSAMLEDLLARLPRLETCVIVSGAGHQSERIYRGLGFTPVSRMDALWGDRPVVS